MFIRTPFFVILLHKLKSECHYIKRRAVLYYILQRIRDHAGFGLGRDDRVEAAVFLITFPNVYG